MQARDIVQVSLLVSVGALLAGVAIWLLALGAGTGSSGSALPPFIVLAGLLVLGIAVLLLGGAAADTAWAWLDRLRGKRAR
ncbi:MAG TPA: hypothetical protein VGR28_12750 [Candidatus Thermoplasmatota archaeon]|nr:hypothetical protein [Candidatus Thermoplasmatota archaeon]